MFQFHFFIITLGLLSCSILKSQEYFDIKNPGQDYNKKCKDCIEILRNKPVEIQFGLRRDYSNELYFYVTHKEWFDQMFKKGSDGIAIDIVNKKRYDCNTEKLDKSSTILGELQKPIYLKELKSKMLPSNDGEVVIKIGSVPNKYLSEDVEFNLIILKKRYLCYYNSFVDLETYRWDLLDMGLYMDTLTYKNEFNSSKSEQEQYILSHKKLRFEIPFEKNKSSYSQKDIKPLYDSLNLTDFNIKKITIRAFSSVEGNTERNHELQKQRAESIINALQEFQEPTIINEVAVAENWVEFLNDIAISNYSELTQLSKDEIKERLKNKETSIALEPYLKEHRKAVVILELQKKNKYNDISTDGLIDLFQKSITEQNLEQAVDIQNSIFYRVKNNDIPAEYIGKLEIPKKSEYGSLLNKNTVFMHLMNQIDVYDTFLELQKLEDLLPKDGHIKYNIAAMKFKIWILGEQVVEPTDFKKEINSLKNYGISSSLIKRMLVNYNIVMSEYYMASGDFKNKDRALKYIYMNYKYLPLTDADYLSLAQYFSSYSKYDWAKKLLTKKVKSIDVDEDLLFYYLNLTLNDSKLIKKTEYRTIMLNAINLNRNRYCDLFDPFGEGGISFQLLESDHLRKTYCENCSR